MSARIQGPTDSVLGIYRSRMFQSLKLETQGNHLKANKS